MDEGEPVSVEGKIRPPIAPKKFVPSSFASVGVTSNGKEITNISRVSL